MDKIRQILYFKVTFGYFALLLKKWKSFVKSKLSQNQQGTNFCEETIDMKSWTVTNVSYFSR